MPSTLDKCVFRDESRSTWVRNTHDSGILGAWNVDSSILALYFNMDYITPSMSRKRVLFFLFKKVSHSQHSQTSSSSSEIHEKRRPKEACQKTRGKKSLLGHEVSLQALPGWSPSGRTFLSFSLCRAAVHINDAPPCTTYGKRSKLPSVPVYPISSNIKKYHAGSEGIKWSDARAKEKRRAEEYKRGEGMGRASKEKKKKEKKGKAFDLS